MPMKRYKPRQIVTLLRQIEVEMPTRKDRRMPQHVIPSVSWLFLNDPLPTVGATMATVLVGEVSHKASWLEDTGGR